MARTFKHFGTSSTLRAATPGMPLHAQVQASPGQAVRELSRACVRPPSRAVIATGNSRNSGNSGHRWRLGQDAPMIADVDRAF